MPSHRLIVAVLVAVLAAAGIGTLRQRPGSAPAPRAGSDVVVRVVDGDTVVLRSTGWSRIIGVDTPEVHGARACVGRAASEFARRLLPPGLRVSVERDVQPRDPYGRALVYLRLPDGRSVNGLLVAQGYALPLTIPPNVRYAGRFAALARCARAKRLRSITPWSRRCDGR